MSNHVKKQAATCVVCGRTGTHARNLCTRCWQVAWRAKRLDQYPPVQPQCVLGMRASRAGEILREHAVPCVDCGTTQGYRPVHSHSPRRSRGRCSACYQIWYRSQPQPHNDEVRDDDRN